MKMTQTLQATAPGMIDRICRNLVLQKLPLIRTGVLELVEAYPGGAGSQTFGERDAESSTLRATLRILQPRAYARIALGGTIGAGEAYRDGDFECSDLTAAIRIFAVNRELQLALDSGSGAVLSPVRKLVHRLHQNSIEGARRNIHAHYDLGNEFFGLFLDSSRMYSAGIFNSADSTLEEAQFEKNERICRKLDLKPSDHLIEIGTGWGGFAIHAASRFGCRITTTTISKEQFKLANERIRAAGLEERISVLLEDYRNLQGQYDKLVSIEMIEAVGLDHLEVYFEKCSSLLKAEGVMVLQGITIRDQYYENAKKSVDFIQKHIFPGTGIPSVESILKATTLRTDLQLVNLEDFGPHYARTLHEWSVRLRARKSELLSLGYSEEFYRLWQFYFSYCEGGFSERSIGVAHFLFQKPGARASSILGAIGSGRQS